jgi:glyoxylase-like metal-dependent hydrolase (beta-lactamase superfamily II)
MAIQERISLRAELVENGGWDGRIQVVRCAPIVDAFFIVSDRYVFFVDTLVNPSTARQMVALARPFLRGGRQAIAINTHADWDHTWGNQVFVGPGAELPALLIGNRKSVAIYEDPASKIYLREMQEKSPLSFSDVRLVMPTLLFDEKLFVYGGDLTLEIFATPGHTVDHCSVYIPEIRTLLVGDAAEAPFPTVREPGLFPQMIASLEHLTQMDAETTLYCHAPGVTTLDLVKENLAYFRNLEAACQNAIQRGLPHPLPEDIELPAALNCLFETVIPERLNPPGLDEFYKTAGHGSQIRMMLAYLKKHDK